VVILTGDAVDRDAFEAATGWALKAQGACRGDVCVPLPDHVRDDGALDVGVIAERLGMPVVHDDETGLAALGPASIGGRALATAEAPDLVLPDLDGNPWRLSSLRGQKVLIVSWAPY
jgi:hypothetical protein